MESYDDPLLFQDIESWEYERMTQNEKRQMRRKNDLRRRYQTHKESPTQTGQIQTECVHHIFGKSCPIYPCEKLHTFRHQHRSNLCYHFLKNACTKGDTCPFMHSTYPCAYYYLGRRDHDQSKCLLMHGKPLSKNWQMLLLQHLKETPKFASIDSQELIRQLNVQHKKLLKIFGMPDDEEIIESNQNTQPMNVDVELQSSKLWKNQMESVNNEHEKLMPIDSSKCKINIMDLYRNSEDLIPKQDNPAKSNENGQSSETINHCLTNRVELVTDNERTEDQPLKTRMMFYEEEEEEDPPSPPFLGFE